MEFKIIRDAEECIKFKDNWTDFHNKCKQSTVFQSFDWNYHWYNLELTNNKLFVIVFFQSSFKDIKALFPLYVDQKGTLRFIADIHCDFSDFLFDSDSTSELISIIKLFSKIIEDTNEVKAIELQNLKQNSLWLADLVNNQDYKRFIYQTNAYSYINIDYSKELFDSFAKLNSKQKNKLKKDYKQNSKFLSRFYGNEISFPIEKVMNIVNDMVKRGDRNNDYLNEQLINLIKTMYISGILKIHETYSDNETVAIQFILVQNNEYIFWIDLYKDIPLINIYSYLRFIELNFENIEIRKEKLNFGRGLYDYKTVKFQPVKEIQLTYFYAKSNFVFIKKIIKIFSKLVLIHFYKKNKSLINKLLRR